MKRKNKDHFKNVGATAALACAATALNAADVSTNSVTIPATPATNSAPPLEKSSQIQQQNWNFHAQSTFVVQGYPGFSAQYSGPNSLPPGGQTRETISVDVIGGLRLWRGAEAHVDGMMWQGFGLANAVGVEGFPNGEAFRLGTDVPNGSLVRVFLRQTIGLGGPQETVPDDALDLAGTRDISRLTFTIGRFSAKDIFDNNAYANDPRTQFMNWGLLANEGWDFPADSIGYTTGLAIELNQPKWTLRSGFFQVPAEQNGLTTEDRYITWPYDGSAQSGPFWKAWGMVSELERRYSFGNHPGTIRFLAYLNRADMAKYSDATAILRAGGPHADWEAARSYHLKYGFGLNWEQEIATNVGVFSRLGWNDDQTEGWMFSDVGYAASFGLSLDGALWDRPDDTYGLAGVINGISKSAQEFFQAGGTGILAGDGNLDYGLEKILETYYDFKIYKNLHGAVNYQFIDNPAFNRARGPVNVFGARLHWEF